MHVARMGGKRDAYRVLVGEPKGKRRHGNFRRRWVWQVSSVGIVTALESGRSRV